MTRIESGVRHSGVALVLGLASLVSACGGKPHSLIELGEEDDCRRTAVVGAPAEALDELDSDSARQLAMERYAVAWWLPPETLHVAQLNAWCAAVGPAVTGGWGPSAPAAVARTGTDDGRSIGTVDDDDRGAGETGRSDDAIDPGDPGAAPDTTTRPALTRVDTLWVMTWNVHVGGGDLRRVVADLREGRLTDGRPVEHFVLLLQEAHREGDLLPEYVDGLPGGSPVTGAPPGYEREDIVAAAERLGLWLLYAPSMRNGVEEDRGNAILSTLPLEDPMAIALPVARQRRVALAASVAGRTGGGREWRLQVANVHLESEPSGWTVDEAERLEQARALLEALPDADAAVAGGDFNTKARGMDEALIPVMIASYPSTPPFPLGPTYRKFGIYRQYLDYLFFRLPPRAAADTDRVPIQYASDHYPVVGSIAW